MKLLVVDNYDSFTWNLVDLLSVAAAASGLDCQVVVVRNDVATLAQLASDAPDAVVLSPGPNTPAQAGICLELVRSWAGRVPILGVCLGHQALAAAFGAEVVRAPQPVHGKQSQIAHDGSGLFTGIEPGFAAMRYHSLCIDPRTLPAGFEATAWLGSEGHLAAAQRVPMALSHRGLRLEGVQFHPESVGTPAGARWALNAVRWLSATSGAPAP